MRHYLGKILRSSPGGKTWHLALFGIILGAVGILSIFALSGTVYAAGGVGSGGNGSGGNGGGSGNWTRYGWGWAIYQTGSAGPNDGFHNGTSWASVQATCSAADASQVYAFDINDDNGNSQVYDYQTVEGGPPTYAAQFPSGIPVDNGRAVSTSIAQAQAAFTAISSPPYNVNTSAFSFGSNVAWFCFNYVPPIPTTPPSINPTCNGSGDITGIDANFPGDNPPITIKLNYSGVNSGLPWPSPPSTEHVVDVVDTPDGHGYWEVTNLGGLFSFGDAPALGNPFSPTNKIIGMAATPDGGGYWIINDRGAVYNYGDAAYVTPVSIVPSRSIVSISADPTGVKTGGYYNSFVTADNTGGVFAYNAPFHGSAATTNIIGISYTPDAGGYWLISSSGAVFNYGDAAYVTPANASTDTIVGVSADPTASKSGGAYNSFYTADNTGHVFGYNSPYYGGNPGASNVVAISAPHNGGGYVMAGSDGGIFNYGPGAGFYGSTQPSPPLLIDTLNAGGGNSFYFNASLYTNVSNGSWFGVVATNSAGLISAHAVFCPGVPNQPTATCSSASVNPTTIGLNQKFSYTGNINYHWPNNSSTSLSGSIKVTINGAGVTGTSAIVNDTSGPPLSGVINNLSVGSVGVYSTTYSFIPNPGNPYTTTNNATSCPGPYITVVNEPYFEAIGSDTSVGVGFCTDRNTNLPSSNTSAQIIGWNDASYGGTTSYNQGAGDQFGAYAPDIISGFASARGLSNSPLGLSFANTGNTATNSNADLGNNYGGYFSSLPACSYDYYSDKPTTATPILSATTDFSGLASGSYYVNLPNETLSRSTLSWGSGSTPGKRIIIYVNGNVDITGNIQYTGAPTNNPDNIPSFELIASGNITIHNTVSQVDGVYIAEPTSSMATSSASSNGLIFTCEGSPQAGQNCGNQLIVNGALDANTIKLWRTPGSAGDGTNNDYSELVNYTPFVWLTQEPSTNTGSSNTSAQTNSIESLPPNL